MMYPKVGHINFLNVLPLTYSYEHGYSEGLSLKYAVPSVLNSDIQNKRLDISPISSIAYARQSEDLLLLPDICIRADCDVESIVLISKKPIDQLTTTDKITLTAKSATSHCLLKIILYQGYGIKPEYYIDNVSVDNPIKNDTTASLLIGDDALYIYLNTPNNLYCYDIGKEWNKLTGYSMVYAIWAVRKDFAQNSSDLLQFTYDRIILGMKNGIKNKGIAIKSVLDIKPFSYDILNHYLGGIIKWNLTDYALKSLSIYYKLAYEMNLIKYIPKFEFAYVQRIESENSKIGCIE